MATEERKITLTATYRGHSVELTARYTTENMGTVHFEIDESDKGIEASCSISDAEELEHLGQWLIGRAAEIAAIHENHGA